MAEIVFPWGVSEIKYIIFIENNYYPYENYNNYSKLSIVFHPMIYFFWEIRIFNFCHAY
jgi:hypothetical protein